MVGPGWQHLEEQIRDIARLNNVHLNEVCEKFGGIEVKTAGEVGTPQYRAFREAIRPIQSASCDICEWCGAPGELRDWDYFESVGRQIEWIKTLCDKHAIMWSDRQHWRSQSSSSMKAPPT